MIRIDEEKCNGCGLCVSACAEGALEIVNGKARVVDDRFCDGLGACLGHCPEGALTVEDLDARPFDEALVKRHLASKNAPLRQWPVKLALLSPLAPFLKDADLVLAADCAGFAHARFHDDLLKGRPFAIACPKLDDPERAVARLSALAKGAGLRSITILRMEVPCCGGLEVLTKMALERAGVEIPVTSEVVEIGPAFGGRGVPMTGGCPSGRA
jgi:NAD-dependent dihydropyrimidine dehydrogenase PreA subunit